MLPFWVVSRISNVGGGSGSEEDSDDGGEQAENSKAVVIEIQAGNINIDRNLFMNQNLMLS